MYRNGTPESYDISPIGQELDFCNIRTIWDDLRKSSDFDKRRQEVEQFNKNNRWRKRGIVMVPQKHGIGFTEPRGTLNSSTALVNVNMTDGSVTIYEGAVEMGQGVKTKLAQLAANTLGIPLEMIRIGGNNTDSITNAPPTAASTGYDLNGGAVEKACRVLRERLENFCRDMEQFRPRMNLGDWRTNWSSCWRDIVFKAWVNRINLSSTELYKSPHYKGPSYRNPRGKPFLYYAYGAAVTEVEIDVLTGEFKILRADAVCDVSKSPNPAIDIGQLEGGFVQGIGFVTTEELIYDHNGRLMTDNIWSYKPPCTKTIPIDFRVRLHPCDEERNKRELLAEKQAVKSSKAFTESSLTLGASVYQTIKAAIKEARQELTGENKFIEMDLPMTCQRIQQLCGITSESLTL